VEQWVRGRPVESRRRLLNGDTVVIDVPAAADLPPATAVSVLSLDGRELEVTSGGPDALAFYLSLSGSRLTRQLTLRSGPVLRHGWHGDDPDGGLVFSVPVGAYEVFGFTTPDLDVEALAGYLADVVFEPGTHGPALRPGGRVTWSASRTHTVAQVVDTAPGSGILLDVRRTVTPRMSRSEGLPVRGGRLSRSDPQERHPYAILEARDFVTYGIPGTEDDLDLVAGVLADITTELL
jgi:hypothetical protein